MEDRNNSSETNPIESGRTHYPIEPNEYILGNRVWKRLFFETLKAIDYFRLVDLLSRVNNEKTYRSLYMVASSIAKKINGRVVITLPDGQVVVDTCKQDGNTFENYMKDVISENHNTRVAIFQAQYEKEGVGYERKLSSTTRQIESSVAVRLGPFRDSAGTIRLSVKD
jgi:hypothetical protein